jgi:UDP-N-acetylmuramate--alanine ligase
MGEFDPTSKYFVYEADEYDRNFLSFQPHMSLISGLDWDHPDIYPTQEAYNEAFNQFLNQSERVTIWSDDLSRLGRKTDDNLKVLDLNDPKINDLTLPGIVNRQDAMLVAAGLQELLGISLDELLAHLNRFPGLSRRFEQIVPGLYSDYAHTPPKIKGALQLAHEVAGDNVVVVYEGLHNTRQHFIKKDLRELFDDVKQLYIVPSYLAREDPNLPLLSPDDLKNVLSPQSQTHTTPAALNDDLKQNIHKHLDDGDTVLCISAGGGNSLDEWLRSQFAK